MSRRLLPRYVVGACALASVAAGCGSDSGREAPSPQPSAMASCIAQVEYDGSSYIGSAVRIEPVAGPSLGTATIPSCGDVAGQEPDPAEAVAVAAIEDVPADVAIVRAGETGTVYIRKDATAESWPAALQHLLKAPACDPRDEPIELAGPWRGIKADPPHSVEPPYDVDLYVARSSAPAYARAYLSVRAPASIEAPLGKAELELLRKGPTNISITARCGADGFVADRISAG